MIKLKPIANQIITEELTMQTYGQLKALIKAIQSKQKTVKMWDTAKGMAVDAVVDELVGKIPGGAVAKKAFDFFKAASKKPDTIKTKSWLDKLDIDDKVSQIIDDTVENGFLTDLTKSMESKPDDEKIPDDFNINKELQNYLSKTYDKRTVAYQEK
jgi:hypothetical protein